MLLLKFLLFIHIISKCYSLPNEEILRRYVRQGLDAVAQDVLSTQDAKILHGYKFNSGIGNREGKICFFILGFWYYKMDDFFGQFLKY